MNILEALNWGSNFLSRTSEEKKTEGHRPQIDANILLCSVLDVNRAYLMAHSDYELNDEQFEKFRKFIIRRSRHEPVSHIIGKIKFFNGDFLVNRHVLTPRPETERLIELILQDKPGQLVVDIGTGSGAIAVTLAREWQKPVIACDIDGLCLAVAKKNSELNEVDHLIDFKRADLWPSVSNKNEKVVIVANLPYIPKRDLAEMDPDVIEYEPRHALFSGHDGLDEIHRLWRKIEQANLKRFDLWLEFDPSQVEFLKDLHKGIRFFDDLAGKTRFAKVTR